MEHDPKLEHGEPCRLLDMRALCDSKASKRTGRVIIVAFLSKYGYLGRCLLLADVSKTCSPKTSNPTEIFLERDPDQNQHSDVSILSSKEPCPAVKQNTTPASKSLHTSLAGRLPRSFHPMQRNDSLGTGFSKDQSTSFTCSFAYFGV